MFGRRPLRKGRWIPPTRYADGGIIPVVKPPEKGETVIPLCPGEAVCPHCLEVVTAWTEDALLKAFTRHLVDHLKSGDAHKV